MKTLVQFYEWDGSLFWIIFVMIVLGTPLVAQTQLDVQGINNTDTVARIRVNYIGSNDVVGLSVRSTPQLNRGIGGYFHGGNRGVFGRSSTGLGVYGFSEDSTGVLGQSSVGIGVVGSSTSMNGVFGSSHSVAGVLGRSFSSYGIEGRSSTSHGAWFSGDPLGGFADIVLGGTNWYSGGDDGVIMSDPSHNGSDIFLVSNDGIVMKLDHNKDEEGTFEVWNQEDRKVMVIFENGQFEIWDGAASNDRTLLLEPDGDLSIDGALTQGSDVNRKDHIFPVDAKKILKSVTEMPVYEWQYKGQERQHIGPMAQDFHKAFSLGEDDTTIAAIDADGITLAAIQAQQELIEEQKLQIESLQDKVSGLELLLKEILHSRPEKKKNKGLNQYLKNEN